MAVVSVTEDQTVDQAGNLTDVYDIVFTIGSQPGQFTVQVPQAGDPVAAASAAIDAKAAEVSGLYGL
jgi:hypothetical protein